MISRSEQGKHAEHITDDETYLIDRLIQDATVINRRLGSEERTKEAIKNLQDNCEDQEVIDEIMRLAATDTKHW
jgi:hypothetical protein